MRKFFIDYINGTIQDDVILSELRDNADFMLDVFRFRTKTTEFDKVTDRLKEDESFIQRTKDIFSSDETEFFNLCMALRKYRKEKEAEISFSSKVAEKEIPVVVENKIKPEVEESSSFKVESVKKTHSEVFYMEAADNFDSFCSLVEQLPIAKDERDLVLAMYQDASDERKIVAWSMVYDFLNYKDKPKSVRLLRSSKKYYYHCCL